MALTQVVDLLPKWSTLAAQNSQEWLKYRGYCTFVHNDKVSWSSVLIILLDNWKYMLILYLWLTYTILNMVSSHAISPLFYQVFLSSLQNNWIHQCQVALGIYKWRSCDWTRFEDEEGTFLSHYHVWTPALSFCTPCMSSTGLLLLLLL